MAFDKLSLTITYNCFSNFHLLCLQCYSAEQTQESYNYSTIFLGKYSPGDRDRSSVFAQLNLVSQHFHIQTLPNPDDSSLDKGKIALRVLNGEAFPISPNGERLELQDDFPDPTGP